jgi:hypothetical protein
MSRTPPFPPLSADFLDGYVTREGAFRDYGVVLSADGAVDLRATQREREARFSHGAIFRPTAPF